MSEKNGDMNQEEKMIELITDDGSTVSFEHLATLEYEGENYLVLGTPDDGSDDEDSEVYILRIEQDDDGNDIYVDPEDEELSEKIFEYFLQLLEETLDDDGEDDD